ncbi:RNA polymerase sigma factor [Sphingomonas crusticola]|uniref:RNA polymerase sigma factor n=1 Tax=Sphingomonas crusticola TaxID=1697973 RepID=UPI001F073B9F|nr:sigma-70 family RNA polymerase sigma factor [Sphingomonas crusticola]
MEPEHQGRISDESWSVDQLSRRYQAVLVRYFCRRGIDLADTRDLAQEVFERLSRPEVRERIGRVEGYLFSIAANLAVEYFRYRQVRRAHPVADIVTSVQRGEEFPPDRLFEGRQELDMVVAALNELPERMRHIFLLARVENLTHAEIAARLGVSKRLVQYEVTTATACLADHRRRVT